MTNAGPPALHELETDVMEQVWILGEATVHAVRDELNARSGKDRAYTTVMTVMSRLCSKGLLKKERRGRSDHYAAAFSREEYLDARAELEVDTLVAEYGDIALAHFVAHVAKLDPSRRQKLRRLARRD
ncbi:MAG: BlaI/MecI/CopY family transcriptional regulator [Egibacteraceae bacterium]